MNASQPFIARVTELAFVGCGCGMALGLLILGACAGAVIEPVAGVKTAPAMVMGITLVVALVIVTLVFLVTKKNADLRVARAQLDELRRQQQPPLVPASTTDAQS